MRKHHESIWMRRKPHCACEIKRRDMDVAAARSMPVPQISIAVFVASH